MKFVYIGIVIVFYAVSLLIAYGYGQLDVRKHTLVRFGSPFYDGVYYGTCQSEMVFDGRRGVACATDGRRNKDGY